MSRARFGERSVFSRLDAIAYLNHAAIAPMADPVHAAAQRVIDEQAMRGSMMFSTRLAEREQLRASLAQLLHAHVDELALVPSTMYGLAALATSIPWRQGARILAFEGEYPTNVSIWQRACERHGLTLTLLQVADFARADGPDFRALDAELARGDVQLCAVSAVQFQTGLRMPLAEIARRCHAHGAELAVDAVQTLGCTPFDVHALGIDYAASGSHKWMLGIDGAGVLFVRAACLQRLRPAIAGAMSHVDAERIFMHPGELRYDRALRGDARVFEGGMLSSVSCAALGAALPMLLDLEPAAIHRHVNAYLDRLEAELIARGFRSLRLPDEARRSCILGVLPPPSAASASRIASGLGARGVVCSGPDGVLRFAPHFANHTDEIPRLLEALDHVLAATD